MGKHTYKERHLIFILALNVLYTRFRPKLFGTLTSKLNQMTKLICKFTSIFVDSTLSGTALSWSWMLTRVPLSWNSNECWNKGPTALRTMILGYVLHLQINFDNFSEIFTTANTFCTKKLTQCCHLKLLIHVKYLNFEHSNPFCL